MRSFKDDTGKEWELKATVGALERVRDTFDIDLLDLTEPGQRKTAAILDNPVLLLKVLWQMVKSQDESMTLDKFMDRLDGESASLARFAFMEELPNFFYDQGQKQVVTALMKKYREFMTAVTGKVEIVIQELANLNMTEAVNSLENVSGNSPESAESTQENTTSGS